MSYLAQFLFATYGDDGALSFHHTRTLLRISDVGSGTVQPMNSIAQKIKAELQAAVVLYYIVTLFFASEFIIIFLYLLHGKMVTSHDTTELVAATYFPPLLRPHRHHLIYLIKI